MPSTTSHSAPKHKNQEKNTRTRRKNHLKRKENGQGTNIWSDGTKYVGEVKDGIGHGQGTMTYPDGLKYEGEFKDGEFWNITEYDKNGNIKGKWINGEEQ